MCLSYHQVHLLTRTLTLGAVPNMQRAAMVNIGDLAAYDYSKRFLMREFQMHDGTLLHVLAGFAAGLVAAILGTPADFIKTRLMNQPVGPDGKYALFLINFI